MAEPEEDDSRRRLDAAVEQKEARKLKARAAKDQTLRIGLGTWGLVGWSIALPTLLGALLGLWLDRVLPASFSWALTLLLGGLMVGCVQAWRSIQQRMKDNGDPGA